MQPEPFASHTQAQPFSDSSVAPGQNAPIASPIGSAPQPSSLQNPASPEVIADDGTLESNDTLAPLVRAHSRGANWFFWIVGLSLVNAVLISFGSDKVLAIGTNATLIMDYIMKDEIAKNASMAGGLRAVEVILIFWCWASTGSVAGWPDVARSGLFTWVWPFSR